MKTLVISSWEEYIELALSLDGWAFRGQENASWPLISSLSRHLFNFLPEEALWHAREARTIRVFRRKAHNYLSNPRALEDDLRCLAMIQHHGGATRLIDFTKSPFVAAFFALEKAIDDVAIYALNTPELWHAQPISEPMLTREVIDPRITDNPEKYFYHNTKDILWAGEPELMDSRLVAQSGTFIMPGVLNKPVDEILKNYSSDKTLLQKIILPKHIRQESLQTLYRMNITNATLFPDLDGLAKSISFESEIIWQALSDK
jgi:hypothetical protein